MSRQAARRLAAGALFLLAGLVAARRAVAQLQFAPSSARGIALGGAVVALPDGVTAAFDNPAAAPYGKIGGAATFGVVGAEQGSFLDPVRLLSGLDPAAIAAGTSPVSAAEAEAALQSLAQPGNGLLGNGAAGLVTGGGGVFGTVADWRWMGITSRPDLVHVKPGLDPATSFAYNTSTIGSRALNVRDIGLGFALSYGVLAVGLAGHYLRGTTYTMEESVFTIDASSALSLVRHATNGFEHSTTHFSVDAGALLTLGPARIGAVVKSLNAPEFAFDDTSAPPADRGRTVTLGRQGRIGGSIKIPGTGLLAALDYDLTTNDTLVDGLQSRQLGGGLEWTFTAIALRAGAFTNLEAASRRPVVSAGVGVLLGPVHLDLAAVYRQSKSDLGGFVTVRVSP